MTMNNDRAMGLAARIRDIGQRFEQTYQDCLLLRRVMDEEGFLDSEYFANSGNDENFCDAAERSKLLDAIALMDEFQNMIEGNIKPASKNVDGKVKREVQATNTGKEMLTKYVQI